MKKDFSTELKAFLEEHSKIRGLDLTFQCKKELGTYRIKIIDTHGDSEEIEINRSIVSDFIKNHSLTSKKEILGIIFNPGPRITNTPGC